MRSPSCDNRSAKKLPKWRRDRGETNDENKGQYFSPVTKLFQHTHTRDQPNTILQTGLQQYWRAPGTPGDAPHLHSSKCQNHAPNTTWHTWRCSFRSYYPENMNATVEAEPTTIPVDSGMFRNTFRPNFWNSSKISRSECVLYPRAKFQSKVPKQATPPSLSALWKVSVFKLHPPLHCSLFAHKQTAHVSFIVGVGILFYTKKPIFYLKIVI